MGAVCHTINPRLFPEQIAYIINHAEDGYVFFDLTFLPLVEGVAAHCPKVKGWVLMSDRAHMPAESKVPLLCYEDLIDGQDGGYTWPTFDENTASSLCYTSGTTGNPKGALYSHRSTVLHSYGSALPDVLNCSARDVIPPVVPMFHVNAWGLPYSVPLVGAKLVFPGASWTALRSMSCSSRNRSPSAGVPTVWLGLLQHVQGNGLKFSSFHRTVIGGSAAPPAMIRALEALGVDVVHAWGMTEMSPLGTAGTLMAKHDALPDDEKHLITEKQGRVVFGVDMKIVDGDGEELPWDGKAFGDLHVRGPGSSTTTSVSMPRHWWMAGSPRGRGHHRRGWLHADHGPQQGRDQVGRGMDLVDRYRERRGRPPGGAHGGLHLRLPSEVG